MPILADPRPALGPPPLRDRLSARLRAPALDQALAAGAQLTAGRLLAARAFALQRARPALAGTLRSLARDAGRARVPGGAPRMRTSAGFDAAPQLLALAAAVDAEDAVTTSGLAQLSVLLADGTGPLWDPGRTGELSAALTRIASALVP